MDIANVLCTQGWMVAAIDSVTFGARASEAEYQQDTLSDWSGAPAATYAGPDGFADPVDRRATRRRAARRTARSICSAGS